MLAAPLTSAATHIAADVAVARRAGAGTPDGEVPADARDGPAG